MTADDLRTGRATLPGFPVETHFGTAVESHRSTVPEVEHRQHPFPTPYDYDQISEISDVASDNGVVHSALQRFEVVMDKTSELLDHLKREQENGDLHSSGQQDGYVKLQEEEEPRESVEYNKWLKRNIAQCPSIAPEHRIVNKENHMNAHMHPIVPPAGSGEESSYCRASTSLPQPNSNTDTLKDISKNHQVVSILEVSSENCRNIDLETAELTEAAKRFVSLSYFSSFSCIIRIVFKKLTCSEGFLRATRSFRFLKQRSRRSKIEPFAQQPQSTSHALGRLSFTLCTDRFLTTVTQTSTLLSRKGERDLLHQLEDDLRQSRNTCTQITG